MPKLVFGTEIDAPPDAVFEYIADLTKHPEWATNPLEIEPITPGPVAVGKRYRSVAESHGVTLEANLMVTEYEPQTRFSFVGTDRTGKSTHHFTVTPRGAGTFVERRIEFELTPTQTAGYYALLYTVRLPMGRKALEQLKAKFEKQSSDETVVRNSE